jgi:Family of unknown function (DUF6236)
MASFYGLYHPCIHFQDEGWLKLAALYWDGLYRMVPGAITPDDTDQVMELIDSGFVEGKHPGMGANKIAEPFRNLIRARGTQLDRKFGVRPSTAWTKLDHVHSEKMDKGVVKELVDHNLVKVQGEWLGVHPQLAKVYMTALADTMAPMVGARPIAENTIDHVAVSGLTVERLSEALLGGADGIDILGNGNDAEMTMASIAIRYVIPVDPAAIEAEQIIQFRKKYVAERAQFQTAINELVAGLSHLKDIRDPRDVKKHLKNEFEKKLAPKLADLKDAMSGIGWDTVDSTAAASFAVPQGLAAALSALGLAATGGVATAIGIALSGWRIWRKRKTAISNRLKPSAESFLYRVERELKPRTVTRDILVDSQKFLPHL